DNTGNDWTFYVHTGAGLVCFNASTDADDDRRPRVIGVRTRPAASTDRAEFERELWWASATEHDLAVPEHGAGLFTPVWIPLEPLRRRRSPSLGQARPGRASASGRPGPGRAIERRARADRRRDPADPRRHRTQARADRRRAARPLHGRARGRRHRRFTRRR